MPTHLETHGVAGGIAAWAGRYDSWWRLRAMELKDPIELHLERVNSLDRRQFLRPMGSNELLERAARIYQIAAKEILPRTALPALFSYVSLVFMATFLLPGLFVLGGRDQLASEVSRLLFAGVVTLIIALPLFVLGLGQSYSVAVGSVNDFVTGDRLPGEPPTGRILGVNVLRYSAMLTLVTAISLSPVLLAAGIFLGGAIADKMWPDSGLSEIAAVFGGLAAFGSIFVSPALMMRFSLVPVVAVVEGGPVTSALRRGLYLAKRHQMVSGIWETALQAVVVFGIVALGLLMMIQGGTEIVMSAGPLEDWLSSSVFGELIRSAVWMAPGYLLLWLLTPFWAALSTTLYYDRRIRVEGYDIRMLAKDVLEVRE